MSDENNALAKLENSLLKPESASSIDEFLKGSESVMLLIDCSGSMDAMMRNGRKRIQGLREVVRNVKLQGEVPMIAFGGPYDAEVRFVDSVPDPDGGTPLHAAIPFAKTYGANRLVVISDGCPDLVDQSMTEAKAFGGPIDVVFVGDVNDHGSFFLDELARATGGKRLQGDLSDPAKLTSAVVGLLMGAVEEPKTVIQGEGFTAAESEPVGTDEDEDDVNEDFEEDEDDDDSEEE